MILNRLVVLYSYATAVCRANTSVSGRPTVVTTCCWKAPNITLEMAGLPVMNVPITQINWAAMG